MIVQWIAQLIDRCAVDFFVPGSSPTSDNIFKNKFSLFRISRVVLGFRVRDRVSGSISVKVQVSARFSVKLSGHC